MRPCDTAIVAMQMERGRTPDPGGTFAAVLEVALAGIRDVGGREPSPAALTLLEAHGSAHGETGRVSS